MINLKKSIQTGISDQALVTRSKSTVKSATRDLAELAPYGVTAELLTNWTMKIEDFAKMTKFKVQRANKNSIFNRRNSKTFELKVATKRLKGQLMFVYSEESNEYASIFSTKLAQINASNLYQLGQNIVEVLNIPNDDLLMYGVTAERIADYTTLVNDLGSLIDDCTHTDSTFSIQTQVRNDLKSEVFKTYKFICYLGKELWTNRNNEYYKDYRMHIHKSPPIIETVSSVPASPEAEITAQYS